MTIDLTDRELSDILEGLDNAIECMPDWSNDKLNTARDRRDNRRKTRKIWHLVKKLIVYAPNRCLTAPVKGASRGSGATVTLNGTELGSNGAKPVATKLSSNGAGLWHRRGISKMGSQPSWRRFDIKIGLTEATAMPRHKGSKELKARAQQHAAMPRAIPSRRLGVS